MSQQLTHGGMALPHLCTLPTPVDREAAGALAVGLVHRPAGTPRADRTWARALLVRHARTEGLHVVDVLELDDDTARTRAVLTRLAHLAATTAVTVLLTDGLDTDLAHRLATDLGLEHHAVPARSRPSWIR